MELSVGKLDVVGNKIKIRCQESMIDRNVEWAYNYVEQANKQHSRFIKEENRKKMEKEKRDKEEKDKLKRIQDKLDEK